VTVRRFIISLILWGLFATAMVTLGFSCWPATVRAQSTVVTLTTNDSVSMREFLLSAGFEKWDQAPPRALAYQKEICVIRHGKGADLLGVFTPPLPNSPGSLAVICLSPHPLTSAARLT